MQGFPQQMKTSKNQAATRNKKKVEANLNPSIVQLERNMLKILSGIKHILREYAYQEKYNNFEKEWVWLY